MSLSLKEKINQDSKEALLKKDSQRVGVLRLLQAAFQNAQIAKRTKLAKSQSDLAQLEKLAALNEEETMAVLRSEVKKAKDSLEQFGQGGRPDLVAQVQAELAVLGNYLPPALPDAEIKKAVKEAIKELGVKDLKAMGKIMAAVMAKLGNRAEGSQVSQIVKEELNN